MRKFFLTLTLMTMSTAALAQAPVPTDLPTPKVGVSKGGVINDGEALFVPFVQLMVAADGSMFIANQKGGASAQAKAKYIVEGFTKEMLQGIAQKVYDDAVARLRAAGYTVKTWNDVKDHPSFAKWEKRENDKDYGMPTDSDPGVTYLVVTPSDDQSLKQGMTGPIWKFKDIAKEQKLVVVMPQYWITAPQVWGEKGSGYKSVSSKVNVAPGMNLYGGFVWMLNPKGSGGSIKLSGQIINISENAGSLEQVDEKSMKSGGSIVSGSMGTHLGAGKISKKTGHYILTVDHNAYSAGLLRGAAAFNQAIADVATAEKGK